MNMHKLGHGVFTWDGSERRSDRYGSFNLCAEPYSGAPVAKPSYDTALADKLEDKRVRLVARVVSTRKSGHIGDLFHGFHPSTPEVGEEVDLGVGIFHSEPCDYDKGVTSTSLIPGEPPTRETFWLDPRKLYRLHDQTVDVFVEETTAEFSPEPEFKKADEGMTANGDGSLQTKHVKLSGRVRLKPKIERLGEGLLQMTFPGSFKAGERIEYDLEGNPTRYDLLNED